MYEIAEPAAVSNMHPIFESILKPFMP